MADSLDWLSEQAAIRDAKGLRRTPLVRERSTAILDLASNNYLGLAQDPRVTAAAADAAISWGAGSTGSRLVTGTTQLHIELEQALADFVGFPAGLVCSTGYHANLAAVTALSGPGTLVVSDAFNHASIVDACRLSRARVVVTGHLDVAAMDKALAERSEPHALLVSDSIFSADADLAPLAELHAIARANNAVLIVDEAHAIGVLGTGGRGALEEAGLAGEPDIVMTGALSKSFGTQGGFVLGSAQVREHLINSARSFIFETGLAPASVAGAAKSLEIMLAEPELGAKTLRRAQQLAEIVGVPTPAAGVVGVIVGDSHEALARQKHLMAQGVWVGCVRPPTVAEGTARLRITARADLTDADVTRFADAWATL